MWLTDVIGELGNTITLGGTDRFAQLATGASDEQLEAMRRARAQNAGVAGDVVNAVGAIATPLKAISLGGRGLQMIRGAGPVSARAAQILGTAPRAAFPSARNIAFGSNRAAALTLGATGLTTMANYNARTDPDAAAITVAGAAPPVLTRPDGTLDPRMNPPEIAALPRDANGNRTVHSDQGYRAVLSLDQQRRQQQGNQRPATAAPAQPASSFERMASAYAAQNGGISLSELAQLAEIDRNGRPDRAAPVRPPSARDQVMNAIAQQAQAVAVQTEEAIAQQEAAGQLNAEQAAGARAQARDAYVRRLLAVLGEEAPLPQVAPVD